MNRVAHKIWSILRRPVYQLDTLWPNDDSIKDLVLILGQLGSDGLADVLVDFVNQTFPGEDKVVLGPSKKGPAASARRSGRGGETNLVPEFKPWQPVVEPPSSNALQVELLGKAPSPGSYNSYIIILF